MDTRPTRERNREKNTQFLTPDRLLLLCVVLALVLLAFACYLLWGNVAGTVKLEAGTPLNAGDFVVFGAGKNAEFASDTSYIDTSKLGEHIVKIHYHGIDFYSTLRIVDTKAPVVTTKEAKVYGATVPEPDVFIDTVEDGSAVTVDYVTVPDMTIEGEQEVQLSVTDAGGNVVHANVKMILQLDLEPPTIMGVQDITLYQGSTASYRSGIVLSDDYDEAPVLTIDSSGVDLSTVGTYTVTYTVTDAAGNITTATATVTVEERPENYVEEAIIHAKADEILNTILTDGMSKEEQVNAIYDWVTENCRYQFLWTHPDRLQSAYSMMTNLKGDCYEFADMCSLFFEKLGIPCIIVERTPEAIEWRGANHVWNMISLDGGQTYYHFDTCEQHYFENRVCLATDAELDACEEYAARYFEHDKSIYPTTPEEAYGE